ncbi:tRNA1(Val) (adenine(37)-N6)-methyltransferase [Roseicyclus mahoneyensis]|uniref:tRNA1(Val) A37 N6-methylase TrmN6 n=1 Tax=Roseicyclus mahoneyensis TaxID=164332 RepID=A0A316GHW9_9RHOB|nr:methyltransferase [Roseicyclus mahoneyensis]PWK60191.1 tRNA1(Val) A37 N6-methylase TrmN6 [Roseicyclus mahoneyensis]
MSTTRDAFLGGRVQITQPRVGYRAATDPVYLAAACPALPGQSVLDLGCGVGTAALCLHARVPGLRMVGVERQPDYAALARLNAAEAGADMTVIEADLTDLPADLRQLCFDHVVTNPPYFAANDGTASRDTGREAANRAETSLGDWIATARARLAPRGWLTLIQTAERLPDCLSALQTGFGAITVLPIQSRSGRAANRVVIRARKSARAPFRLLPPFLVHEGPSHAADAPDFTPQAEAVLRHAAPLALG